MAQLNKYRVSNTICEMLKKNGRRIVGGALEFYINRTEYKHRKQFSGTSEIESRITKVKQRVYRIQDRTFSDS